jgi:thiamine-monophosphate kinase
VNELEAIARITRRSASPLLGDDCAILRPRPGEDLLVTTDLLLEGVHFEPGKLSARDCGWRALARGLSDIAAMGGAARWCFVSLALPEWADARWLDGFYDGLLALARAHRVQLAGGDLSRTATFACDIVVLGAVPRGKALRRDGGRSGDLICVSGSLGRAAARGYRDRPEPRLALGKLLRSRLKATACLDLSDGLALDLHRLATASGLAAELDASLPIFPGASLDQALHGGEDYELLFTVAPSCKLPATLAGLPLTAIGFLRPGAPGSLLLCGQPLAPHGWDPFQATKRGRKHTGKPL